MVKIIIRLLSIFSKIVSHVRCNHWSDGYVLFYFGYLIFLLWLPGVCQLVVAQCNDVVALCCARVSQTSKDRAVNLPSMSLLNYICVCVSCNYKYIFYKEIIFPEFLVCIHVIFLEKD